MMQTLNLNQDFQQISCDFDQDFCGYQPNEFVSRISGPSPGHPLSGPDFDHTTGKKR
jgi:hypothetical protein